MTQLTEKQIAKKFVREIQNTTKKIGREFKTAKIYISAMNKRIDHLTPHLYKDHQLKMAVKLRKRIQKTIDILRELEDSTVDM